MQFFVPLALLFGYICAVQSALNWVPDGATKDCGQINQEVLNEDRLLSMKAIKPKPNIPGMTPWQVSIYRQTKQDKEPRFVCSGSIIKSHIILTAAQCFRDTEESTYTAVAGDYDRTVTGEESEQRFEIKPSNTFIHDKYDNRTSKQDHDIAIVRLDQSIKFNKWAQPICLPSKSLEYKPGTICEVAGFGLVHRNLKSSSTLQIARVPIVSDTECKAKYATVRHVLIEGGMFCTGGECQANSGAPIVCEVKENNRSYWIQYGITSFAKVSDCTSNLYPTVNTKLSSYVDWLDHKLKVADTKVTIIQDLKWK